MTRQRKKPLDDIDEVIKVLNEGEKIGFHLVDYDGVCQGCGKTVCGPKLEFPNEPFFEDITQVGHASLHGSSGILPINGN